MCMVKTETQTFNINIALINQELWPYTFFQAGYKANYSHWSPEAMEPTGIMKCWVASIKMLCQAFNLPVKLELIWKGGWNS